MKSKLTLFIFLVIAIIFIQCDKKDSGSKCDATKHQDTSFELTAPVNSHGGGLEYDTRVSSKIRYYTYSRSTYFVCIYSPVTVYATIRCFDDYMPSDFSYTARVFYNTPAGISELVSDFKGKIITGVTEVNLEPSFQVGSGSFSTIVEISFPTSGNPDQDELYLLGKVASVSIRLLYYATP